MAAPVVIYSCGMSGIRRFDRRFVDELRRHGHTVEVHDWVEFRWPLHNLRDRRQHHRAAVELVQMIRDTRQRHPDGPIIPVGHSTGCLLILEALPQLDRPVPSSLMLAAAVSPRYDLTPALAGCHRLIHVGSCLDQWFCGLGTTVCGTADGQHGPAASSVGFRGPGSDNPRFVQHMFRPGWWLQGHYGGHVGCLSRRFVRNQIVPILREGSSSRQPPDDPRTPVAERSA